MSPECSTKAEACEVDSPDYDPFDEAVSIAAASPPATPVRGRSRSRRSPLPGVSRSRSPRGARSCSRSSSGACTPPPGIALRHNAGLLPFDPEAPMRGKITRVPSPPPPPPKPIGMAQLLPPPPPPPPRSRVPLALALTDAPEEGNIIAKEEPEEGNRIAKDEPEDGEVFEKDEPEDGEVVAKDEPVEGQVVAKVEDSGEQREKGNVVPPMPPPPPFAGQPLTEATVKELQRRRLCLRYLSGSCAFGENCFRYHPGWRLASQLRAWFLKQPCRWGRSCISRHCLFWHDEPVGARVPSSRPKRERSDSSDMSGSASRSSSPGSSYSSDTDSAAPPDTPAPSRAFLSPSAPAQWLQYKLEPYILFDGPQFCVASKPAGWAIDAVERNGSGVAEMKDFASSGWVEPLRQYFSFSPRSWHPILSPAASVSGWALVARCHKSIRCLADVIRSGTAVSYSMAMIEGEPDPTKLSAVARRDDGFLEVAALASLGRYADGGWSGEEGVENYTLLLIKATGSACGGERAILPLVFGYGAVGDTEYGGRGAAELFGSRPFFHNYALTFPDPWAGDAGLSITCPLPGDLRNGLATMWTNGSTALHKALVDGTACTPHQLCILAGSESPASLAHSAPPEPTPFGGNHWNSDGKVTRHQWIAAFVLQALRHVDEYQLPTIPGTGQVHLSALLKRFPSLSQAVWNQKRQLMLTLSKKDRSQALEVDSDKELVRRRSACERLQIFVEQYVSLLPPSSRVPVKDLLENSLVRNMLCDSELPKRPILECLRPCVFFDVNPSADALVLRPLKERARLGVEQVFACPDKFLAWKLLDGHGSVPLSWFCVQYRTLLTGGSRNTAKKEIPFTAARLVEMAAAMEESTHVIVDRSTLSIRAREGGFNFILKAASGNYSGNIMYGSGSNPPLHKFDGPPKNHRAALAQKIVNGDKQPREDGASEHRLVPTPLRTNGYEDRQPYRFSGSILSKLRGLLRHYFEPFNLQHNRLLLYSAEPVTAAAKDQTADEDGMIKDAAVGAVAWRWLAWRVAKDMRRIDDTLSQVPFHARALLLTKACEADLHYVRLVRPSDADPFFELTYTPEFRMPVLQPYMLSNPVSEWAHSFFVKSREVMPQLPERVTVVLSYCLEWARDAEDSGLDADKRQQLIIRQMRAYDPDIVCLQRCEAHLTTPLGSTLDDLSDPGEGKATDMLDGSSALAAICAGMETQDYEWWAVPMQTTGGIYANVVLWKRSVWRAASRQHGAGGSILVELEPQKGMIWQLSVGCLDASNDEESHKSLKGIKELLPSSSAELPSVLCGAFGVAPPRISDMLRTEGISGFRSAHREVLGRELDWTQLTMDFGELGFRSTDGIWLGGGASLRPLAVLSELNKESLRRRDGRKFMQTLPSDHLPLLAALEYKPVYAL